MNMSNMTPQLDWRIGLSQATGQKGQCRAFKVNAILGLSGKKWGEYPRHNLSRQRRVGNRDGQFCGGYCRFEIAAVLHAESVKTITTDPAALQTPHQAGSSRNCMLPLRWRRNSFRT